MPTNAPRTSPDSSTVHNDIATRAAATHDVDVTLHNPGELLASLPSLLGFHPVDSVVALGLCGPRGATIGVVLRVDLPPPGHARQVADRLWLPLVHHDAVAVVLVVVGGRRRTPDDDLPHRELLARCESRFVDSGMPVVHQLWTPDTVGGRRWYCYDEVDCTDVLSDPGGTDLAAVAAETGCVTYDRREDIEATLTPEPDDVLARRSALLTAVSAGRTPTGTEPGPALRLARFGALQRAIAAAARSSPVVTDDDVVDLADALADHRVRDICLDFDDLPDVIAAERFWTALARATPPPERAEPACLLAFSAYARGDGVLAGIALTEAEQADPGHRLSQLLRTALAMGVSPGKLRDAGIKSATYARQSLSRQSSATGAIHVSWRHPVVTAPPSARQSPDRPLQDLDNRPLGSHPTDELSRSAKPTDPLATADSLPTAEHLPTTDPLPTADSLPTAEHLLMGDLS